VVRIVSCGSVSFEGVCVAYVVSILCVVRNHVFFYLDGLRPAFVISQVALYKPCGKIQCTVLLSLTAIAHFTIT